MPLELAQWDTEMMANYRYKQYPEPYLQLDLGTSKYRNQYLLVAGSSLYV